MCGFRTERKFRITWHHLVVTVSFSHGILIQKSINCVLVYRMGSTSEPKREINSRISDLLHYYINQPCTVRELFVARRCFSASDVRTKQNSSPIHRKWNRHKQIDAFTLQQINKWMDKCANKRHKKNRTTAAASIHHQIVCSPNIDQTK